MRGDTVTDALDNAMSLSVGQPSEDQAWQASMAVIHGMHAYDADRALTRICPWDYRPLPDWAAAAVAALRLDTRPGYGGLQDSERHEILRPFLRVPREDLAAMLNETPLGPELAEIGKTYLPGQPLDSYAVADVLARGEAWALAQDVADESLRPSPTCPPRTRGTWKPPIVPRDAGSSQPSRPVTGPVPTRLSPWLLSMKPSSGNPAVPPSLAAGLLPAGGAQTSWTPS